MEFCVEYKQVLKMNQCKEIKNIFDKSRKKARDKIKVFNCSELSKNKRVAINSVVINF